jgi:hypothetical protein
MRKLLMGGIVLGAALVLALSWNGAGAREDKSTKSPRIVHSVYFALKDNSPAQRDKLIAACKKYLTKHPGTVYFAAGGLAEELKRPVNDRDFDVNLLVVFESQKFHDQYQDAERHKQFIEENKDNWKKVRVFDSAVHPD